LHNQAKRMEWEDAELGAIRIHHSMIPRGRREIVLERKGGCFEFDLRLFCYLEKLWTPQPSRQIQGPNASGRKKGSSSMAGRYSAGSFPCRRAGKQMISSFGPNFPGSPPALGGSSSPGMPVFSNGQIGELCPPLASPFPGAVEGPSTGPISTVFSDWG